MHAWLQADGSLGHSADHVFEGVLDRPADAAGCVQWALQKFDTWFHRAAASLVAQYPPGHKTEGGADFWGGTKRMPTPLTFDPADAAHTAFVLAAARLRARTLGQRPLEASELQEGAEGYDHDVKDTTMMCHLPLATCCLATCYLPLAALLPCYLPLATCHLPLAALLLATCHFFLTAYRSC